MAIVTTAKFFTRPSSPRRMMTFRALFIHLTTVCWLAGQSTGTLAVQVPSAALPTHHPPHSTSRPASAQRSSSPAPSSAWPSSSSSSPASAIPSLPLPHNAVKVNVSQLLQAPSWWETLSSSVLVSQEASVILPPAMVNLRKLIQQAEDRITDEITPRLLSLNRGARFRGDLVVWIPISFFLPTIIRDFFSNADSEEGEDEDFRRRTWKVSEEPKSSVENEIFEEPEQSFKPGSDDYRFHPVFGPLLSRLDGYFQLLRIRSPACQLKLICLTSQGEKDGSYLPLSDLFRTAIKRSEDVPRPTHYHTALRRYFNFRWAAEKGATLDCDEEYAECPASLDQLINLPILRIWQTMAKKLAIQLQDE